MKLSLLALASVAPVASADFSLRAAVNQMLSSAKAESYDAHIIVGGLTGGATLSKEEVSFASKQAGEAFNQVFADGSKKIADISPRGSSTIAPENV